MKALRKTGKILIFVILGVLVTFLFIRFVHPTLAYSFQPPFSYHSGAEHYTSGRYVEYEDGELFREFTESLDFVDDGEAVDFFHANYWMRDNPFIGKASDYFILDLHFDETEYAQIKELLQNEAVYGKPIRIANGDYWCYGWRDTDKALSYVIAYRDEDQTLRLCLTTQHTGDIKIPNFVRDTPGWFID